MNALRTGLCSLTATLVALALPAAATAAYLVPPENSAATQYTEAYPSAGGPKDAGKSGHAKGHSTSQVLGPRNAQKLAARGQEGEATAAVAAETAPAPAETLRSAYGSAGGHGDQSRQKAGESHGSTPAAGKADHAQTPMPAGSSGIGEVIARATGSSSGGFGLFLPLAIVATIAWAFAYWTRQRKRSAA